MALATPALGSDRKTCEKDLQLCRCTQHPPSQFCRPWQPTGAADNKLGAPGAGTRASLVAQLVKNPPAIWETWVLSLGWEDPLEEGMATHSSIPAWRIPWTEEPGGLQFLGSQRVAHDWVTKHSTDAGTSSSYSSLIEAWNSLLGLGFPIGRFLRPYILAG